MPQLVRQDVSLGELPGRAEAVTQLVVEAKVDVDLVVAGTVERPAGGLGEAARGIDAVAEQHQVRVLILRPLLRQQPGPRRLSGVEHEGDELYQRVLALRRDDAVAHHRRRDAARRPWA